MRWVSVYHNDKNKKMTMDLSSDSNIDVAHKMHIHSFTVDFEGPDKITQQWTSYAEGKKAQVVKVTFTRNK